MGRCWTQCESFGGMSSHHGRHPTNNGSSAPQEWGDASSRTNDILQRLLLKPNELVSLAIPSKDLRTMTAFDPPSLKAHETHPCANTLIDSPS
jgi:hypothetical protein